MKTKRCWRVFIIGFMCLSSLLLLSLAVGQVALAEQKGEVVIATYFPVFYQKGGDPATQVSGYPTVSQHVFDSLVWVDREQNIKPGLAKSWSVKGGWTDMEFDLRDDVTFHDGSKFTAEDVKFSLETYLRPKLRYLFAPLWRRNIKSVEVLGPYRVRIVLNSPDPGFLIRMWWGAGIMPKAYREKVGDNGFADKPVGTGPFKWLDYKQDVYWRAEAVPKHFRHTPAYKNLKVMYVGDHSTRLAMLKAGEADIIDALGPHIPQIKAAPNLRLIMAKHPHMTTVGFCDLAFPDQPSPFHDIRVREAASLAIDRQTICDKLLFGASEPYGEILSPITLGYDPTIKPDPYDPEKAKKLLAEAGYAKGFETEINTLAATKYWFEAIASNLADVGIKAKINVIEGGTYRQLMMEKKLKGLIYRAMWWHCERHPAADMSDMWLKWMPGAYNTTDEIHNTIMAGMTAQSDEDMAAAGRKISKVIRDSRQVIILWVNNHPYGVSNKIAYWEPQLGAMPATAWEFIKIKE